VPIYGPFLFLEDFPMARKPTYEELEEKLENLKKGAILWQQLH